MAFVPIPRGNLGMENCRSFLDIPPLVHWKDGSTCINPDFDMVSKFHLSAQVRDPSTGALGPVGTLAPDEQADFIMSVEQEENGMGHFLINELLLLTDPPGAGSIYVDIKDQQSDRSFTNGTSVFPNTVFGNAQLNTCLPCPIMLLPRQSIVFTLRNLEPVDLRIQIVARGKRFMPYHDLPLRDEMARCWLRNPSSPMWLGVDGRQVQVPAGGNAQGTIVVPGGGYFELKAIRGKVQPVGSPNAEDVLVNVTEGRVGKRLMNEPIPLNLFMTEDRRPVPGMPGDVYRSASAEHCPGPSMIFRGNTRIIHDFTNLDLANDAFIELTYVGCFHRVSRCPPYADLERVRNTYNAFDGPLISGSGAYEQGTMESGVYEQDLPAAPLAGLGDSRENSQGEWERI